MADPNAERGYGGQQAPMHGQMPMQQPPRSPTKMIVGLLLIGLLSTGICVGLFFWWRSRQAASAASVEATASSTASAEGKIVRGAVKLPAGQTKAVVRVTPSFDGSTAGLLDGGTVIEITNSTIAKGQTWHRIRTVSMNPQINGWMHADVVKMDL